MKKKKFNFSFVHQKFHIGWRLDRIQASSYSNNCISQGRYFQTCLTFKNRASYIEDGRNVTLQMLHFNIFSTNISTEYFKHAAHSPFFSSKCRLFHNAIFFGFLYCFAFYIHGLLNLNVKFKVCKSVHHRTIKINHQPHATIFQFIILTFVYSSTCFGRFLAHHQELNDCSGSLWFYLRIVMIVVLSSWLGRPADPEHSMTLTTI